MMGVLELLASRGILLQSQITEALDRVKKTAEPVDQVLESLGIDADAIRSAKADYFGIPAGAVGEREVPFDVLRLIPEESARHYMMVPLEKTDTELSVGMVDPGDAEARQALSFITGKLGVTPKVSAILFSDFDKMIGEYRGVASDLEGTAGDGEEVVQMGGDRIIDDEVSKPIDPNTIVEDAPATKYVATILKSAVDGGASDIHIENTGDEMKVRYRFDGVLHTTYRAPKALQQAVVARIKVLAKMKLDERRKPQDSRFMASVSGRIIDFRVSVLPTFFGEKAVIRILDPERGVKRLEDVGMTDAHLAQVREAMKRPYGLILITGPTGSGKTTTLYAMLNEVDREKLNVVTLEDPVEYTIAGISQSPVRPEIGYTFATGLRSILRQDPDVIMVGEIRDKETAELAINAALTGHLVLATLHTNNALGVIPRLVDMGIDPYLIAPTLIMSMAQRLVRKFNKIPGGMQIPIDEARQAWIKEEFKDYPEQFKPSLPLKQTISETEGTPGAEQGLGGRIAAFEMFSVDKEIEHIILTTPTEPALYDYLRKKGMLTMKEDALFKCMNGVIPWSEVNTL
jgi:type IV pilus assembly protein PilB